MVTAIFSGRCRETGDGIFIRPQKEYRGIEQAALRLVSSEGFQIFTLLAEAAVICTAANDVKVMLKAVIEGIVQIGKGIVSLEDEKAQR
ncbi:hypothetical protein P5673_006806 [Acropora cervicornis]|uniref:Uncharacterized protein n=1 Tax=Acropora cervicornis TaxID=6130 RepID=A0AAD9QWF5_ACRCE|nr:hypothetical protein P5673_006806 [Acropora cervicornis]